jgi:hypothetical protein
MAVKVLALDLERALVDNALSGRPRPGLFEFLTFCLDHFERIVLFTSVEVADAREVLQALNHNNLLPAEFLERLEFFDWSGEYKDLCFIPDAAPNEVILVDDDAGWARPDQRDRLLLIDGWDGGPDAELLRVQTVLEEWVTRERVGTGR